MWCRTTKDKSDNQQDDSLLLVRISGPTAARVMHLQSRAALPACGAVCTLSREAGNRPL